MGGAGTIVATTGEEVAVPAPTPARDRDVYFVGAGLSSAAGLPNTPALIESVLELGRQRTWLIKEGLARRLQEAFVFFYPDAEYEGFRPGVVDFFSALRTFLDIGSGLRGTGFTDAPELYRVLKLAIANVLIEKLRELDDQRLVDHAYLQEVVRPGNVVITSNWDLLIERAAQAQGTPVRLVGEPDETSLLVLKLHGSIDWCIAANTKRAIDTDSYATLTERVFPPRPYTVSLQDAADDVNSGMDGPIVRTRCLEEWSGAWRLLRSRIADPHMVTMVRGKSGDLGPLQDVWRAAYGAVSRARNVEVVGYSMPEDDTEIRTLLRTGIRRGRRRPPKVTVRNPSPDVHERVRAYLDRQASSEYLPIDSI
jgi:hypothetical protein